MIIIAYTYILKCSDNSLYTGYTTDIDRRLSEHNNGIGSKYTRSRLPVTLVYYHSYPTKSDAMREEWRIKHRLTRSDKFDLINSSMNELIK